MNTYTQIFKLQSQLYKALANPKRLEIINLLRDQQLTVTQIVNMLGLPQANISQHLMILRQQKLVSCHKQGKEILYKLAHPNLIATSDLTRELLIDLHDIQDQLAQQLRTKMKKLVPLVKDPVCGMRFSPQSASYVTQFQNQPYYFCAEGCLNSFQKTPAKFIK